MRRLTAVLLGLLLAVAALPSATHAKDLRRIADDVRVGSLAIGGLTVDRAAQRLEGRYGARLRRDVTVRVVGRRFRLKASRAKVVFDSRLTAVRAYRAGRARDDRGGTRTLQVALALKHSGDAAYGFAARVAAAVRRRPRDASVRLGIAKQRITRSRKGRVLDARALGRRVDRALAEPSKKRALRASTRRVRPAVTVEGVRRRYGTIVTVDRASFRLRLFKRLKWVKTYGVATGMAGLETPAGRYRITSRQVNPAWHVPNSDWAGSLRGQVIPGGAPNNPLKARWLGITGGVGIHGTAEEWSIGSRASHGCIRMRVADVKALYPRVPLGSTVIIR